MILGTAEEGLAMALSSTCPSSTTFLGGRAIDRCNPIIRDARRLGKVVQMNTTDTEPPSPPPQPGTDQKFVSGMNNIIHQTEKKKKAQMIYSLWKEKRTTSSADSADKMVNKTGSTSKAAIDDYEIIVDSPGDSSRYLLTTTNSSSSLEMKSFVYSHRFDPRLAMVEQSSSTSSFSSPRVTSSPASAAPNHQVRIFLIFSCKIYILLIICHKHVYCGLHIN